MKFSALLLAAVVGTSSAFVAPTRPTASSTVLDATIAVFGASGLTAEECVYQAIKDGDTVVGLTRNPSNVMVPKGSGGGDADKPFTDPNLTVIAGDVTNAADVAKGKRNIIALALYLRFSSVEQLKYHTFILLFASL